MSIGDSPLTGLVLLRRVHSSSLSNGRLNRGAFTPNRGDSDGLSFFDASQVTAEQMLSALGNRADQFRVIGIPANAIAKLGLQVVASPDEGANPLPGHYLLSDFSFPIYENGKRTPEVRKQHLNAQQAMIEASIFVDGK